jgi:Uncharacterised nucleotidyltransferase
VLALSPEAASVALAFIVGSPDYRRRHVGAFRSSVDALGASGVARLAERTHVTGLLQCALRSTTLAADMTWADADAVTHYQHFHNRLLIEELGFLSTRFAARGIRPVILKGLGHWGTLYSDLATRRVQDLDLLVTGEQMLPAWAILKEAGYLPDGLVDARSELKRASHYHLPPISRTRRLSLDAAEQATLEHVRSVSDYHMKFEHVGGAVYEFRVDIELHRSVFLFDPGGFPIVRGQYSQPHPNLDGYRILRDFVNLPYLGAKFALDVEELQAGKVLKLKSLKLLADVVKSLLHCSARDLSRSIELSARWGLDELYRSALTDVSPLVPEVAFANVQGAPRNTLALFAAGAVRQG